MLTVLDRYILRALIVNYAIGLAVMISLYVVLDMFVNIDEFTEQGYPLLVVLKNIFSYYWPNVFLYFRELSSVITLFACMATIARMRKSNELTAVLASGVSLYRVAWPVFAFGLATTALRVADTELVIPRVAHLLARDHDDVDGAKAYEVLFLEDRDGALLSAGQFHPQRRDLKRLLVMKRGPDGSIEETLEADLAVWEPLGPSGKSGRWKLERGIVRTRVQHPNETIGPRQEERVEHKRYYESDLSPEAIQLRQTEGWVRFLSLVQLRELEKDGTANLDALVQTRHSRIAAPLVGIVLLLLGLPFFLDRTPGNIAGDTGKCMLACGLCYIVAFVIQSLRPTSASALSAWIPIFIFATIAMVKIDRIRT